MGVEPAVVSEDVRRRRVRRPSLRIDKQRIVDRVKKLYERDLDAYSEAKEARIQRAAKLRLWTEGTDYPWPGASDVALPVMAEKSESTQDTINNAVINNRPAINSRAIVATDEPKQDLIDNLIDYQVFEEQPGETVVAELAQSFVDDGVAVAFVPWVRERKKTVLTRIWEPIPDEVMPELYFRNILQQVFNSEEDMPASQLELTGQRDGWDWRVTLPEVDEEDNNEIVDVSFYTRPVDDRVEIVYTRDVTVYDGPRVIPKDFEEVLAPPRSANLQAPSPSNPGGASHVILVDRPTVGEIAALVKRGVYDLAKPADVEQMRDTHSRPESDFPSEQLKDDLMAVSDGDRVPEDRMHRRVTRLMCFDTYDLDGDGIAEDVIWWTIYETDTMLRAKKLSEVYPGVPPRRPLAEASFIPVNGRRVGVSLSEMTEGLQDVMKTIIDQVLNAGDIQNTPFGFYRPQGSMQPESISLAPGELYPLSDPQRDVVIPNIQNNAVGFGINMFSLMQQMLDRLTLIDATQLGQVPAGKSSALRTSSGIAQLTAKGEARPERILRRFFGLLVQVWEIVHQHNQHFLSRDKQIRITGLKRADQDPYATIQDKAQITGVMKFGFKPAVLNTDPAEKQQAMQAMLAAYATPLALQLGVIDQDGLYSLLRDWGKALGGDPDQYLKPPLSTSMAPKISAEEAVTEMIQNTLPFGVPSEAGGWMEHAQKLIAFSESVDFGLLSEQQVEGLFIPYAEQASANAQAQIQQEQALQEAASEFQSQNGGQAQRGGRPSEGRGQAEASNQSPPAISGPGEMINEGDRGAG